MDLTTLINVTKNSISDVAGVVDLALSLLGEVFQSYLGQEKDSCFRKSARWKMYIFNFKKQTKAQKKQEYKKAKETKKEMRISPENQLKK